MSEYFETRVSGQITAGSTVAACPKCNATKGLTIHGRRGEAGRLRCRSGHDFPFPRAFNAAQMLRQSINDPRRDRDR